VAHAVENQLYNFYNITVVDEDVDSTYVMTIVAGNVGTKIQVLRWSSPFRCSLRAPFACQCWDRAQACQLVVAG
jgi:hypothetical protein